MQVEGDAVEQGAGLGIRAQPFLPVGGDGGGCAEKLRDEDDKQGEDRGGDEEFDQSEGRPAV